VDYFQAIMRLRKDSIIYPLYLLSGPEDYLKEEFLQELLKYLEQRGKSFFLERLDGRQVNLSELMSGVKQSTLFSGGRLLWVSNPPYLSSSKKKENTAGEEESPATRRSGKEHAGEEELLAFLQGEITDSVIIFSVHDVDRRKKLVKAIEEAGMLIDFSSLKGAFLKKWIKEQFSKEKKKVEEEALNELVERLGENLHLLKREIEKIVTYMAGERIVTRALVQYLVPESRQGNIFNLVESIGQKNIKGAFFHLHKLRRQNEHPLVILAMVARQFRLLYQFLVLQEKGLSQREIIAFLKVQPFVARELASQVERYNRHTLASVIAHLKETDLNIKTGRLEANDALEQLVLHLTARGNEAFPQA
jgi:DNA polymerase-3 subunit delta